MITDIRILIHSHIFIFCKQLDYALNDLVVPEVIQQRKEGHTSNANLPANHSKQRHVGCELDVQSNVQIDGNGQQNYSEHRVQNQKQKAVDFSHGHAYLFLYHHGSIIEWNCTVFQHGTKHSTKNSSIADLHGEVNKAYSNYMMHCHQIKQLRISLNDKQLDKEIIEKVSASE